MNDAPGIELLAIDLDGTLVDSAPDLACAVDAALASLELPAAGEQAVRGWIGDGIEVLVERALAATGGDPVTQLEPALAEFTRVYRAQVYELSRLYEGVPETLAALAARGLALACITNKREAFARAVLEQAGILDAFDFVIGGDTLPAKKPDPLPLVTAAERAGTVPPRSVMVGDSHHDLHAAAATGFAFVWAAYGYCADLGDTAGVEFRKIEAFGDVLALI